MEVPIPQPGAVLVGKYRVERTLGQGGMAVVLEATHLALGQRVAVKLLRGQAAKNQEVVARFLREAQIAAQLPPEHIARVTDVGQTQDGTPYLVMELLVGRDLAQELHARGRLPVSEAVDLVLQACEGVAEAHAVGLVHRDLKPANIFLTHKRDGAPVVKVLDFGLSKAAADKDSHALTQTTSNFGTPQYMSPEQIQSAKHVDARTDQHALAMVLFELLSGVPAYEADTITALAVVIATKPPPKICELRKDVSVGLGIAIQRALSKRPEDRYADVAAFAAMLAPHGGPGAASAAKGIANVLASVVAPVGPARAQSERPAPAPLFSAPDEMQTAPLQKADDTPVGPPPVALMAAAVAPRPAAAVAPRSAAAGAVAPRAAGPMAQTQATLTRSGGSALLGRPRKRMVAVVTGAAVVGVLGFLVLLAMRPTDNTVTGVLPAADESELAPSVAPTPSPSVTAAPAAVTDAPDAAASAAASGAAPSASAPPASPPRAAPRRPTRPRR